MPDQAKAIFLEAVEKPRAEQIRWVQEACGGDVRLCRRVQELLAAHSEEDDSFIEQPAIAIAATAPHPSSDGILGDFRLVREIGRGGMGIVYEAQQISLKRRVALKVLPFAAVLDNRQLQRFRTEAMAAARLHHQHIVPVFQVGCERAVHFYAMQYVEGQNIAQLLHGMRMATSPDQQSVDLGPTLVTPSSGVQPSPPAAETSLLKDFSTDYSLKKGNFHRRIVTLGIQAAEALDYAHQQGILHRDIKPSNLMLDAAGDLWITDFGLARIEGDEGLTMSGDLLGTLRYMSPEQVLGQRVVIDQRTDIYSLGVSLYEMLSLKPANQGSDRAELLRQISFEHPLPLRKHDPSIPADLETIVHTAMAREPHRRYETAQEFADDLQRFLDGKPIFARRPSRAEHMQKWVARNKQLTAALALLLVTGIVAVAAIASALRQPDGLLIGAAATDLPIPVVLARAGGRILPGLIPEPPLIPDVGRWQLITKQPRGILRSAVWSPDETSLAVAEANHVRIYDSRDMQLLHILVAHSQPVRSVAWHPDGKRLASCSEDGTVRLWTATGVPTHLLSGHTGPVYQVAWRPDGSQLASAAADGTVRLWSADGEALRTLDEGQRHVFGIDWSPDGTLLASVGGDIRPPGPDSDTEDNSMRIWDPDTGKLTSTMPASARYSGLCVDWRPDGRQIAVGYGKVFRQGPASSQPLSEAGVWIWNSDGTGGLEVGRGENSVSTLAWRPDGLQIAFSGRVGQVWIWDADSQQVTDAAVEKHVDTFRVAWNATGSSMLVTSRDLVREWDGATKTDTLISAIGRDLGYFNIAWSPDGQMIYCQLTGSGPHFLSPKGAVMPAPPATASSSPAWWERTNSTRRPDGVEAPAFEVSPTRGSSKYAWSKDGWLARASWEDHTVTIWNETGKLVATCHGHRGGVESVAWSPDGTQLASGGGDSVRIWNRDGSAGPAMTGHEDEVYGVAWSPDGQWIASGSSDSTVRLWKPNGEPGPVLRGHQGGVYAVAFSPDSKKLVSGAWLDNSLRVWDIATGQTEWQELRLNPTATVVLNAHGAPLSVDRDVLAAGLYYAVEKADGSIILRSIDEFERQSAAGFVESFVAGNDLDQAVAAFETLLNTRNSGDSDPPEISPGTLTKKVAEFFAQHERHRETVIVCNSLLKNAPQHDMLELRGAAHIGLKEYEKALVDYTQIVDTYPDGHASFWNFPDVLLPDCPPDQQQAFFDLLKRAAKASPQYLDELAQFRIERGEYDEALADFATLLKDVNDQSTIDVGVLIDQLGECPRRFLSGLLEVFQQALQRAPSSAVLHNQAARVHWILGEPRDALRECDAALALDSTNDLVRQNLATMHARFPAELTDRNRAVLLAQEAVDHLPDYSGFWSTLIEAQHAAGDLQAALVTAKTMVERWPKDPECWCILALAHYKLGLLSEAEADMQKAAELVSLSISPDYCSALALLELGERERWRQTCAHMLERFGDTKNSVTANCAAWTCALAPDAVPNFDQVIALSEFTFNADSDHSSYRQCRAAILYRAGRFEEAIKLLNSIIAESESEDDKQTHSPAYNRFFLAMAYHRLGDAAQAAEFLQAGSTLKQAELMTGPAWNRRVTLKLLEDEATALIQGESKPVDSSPQDLQPDTQPEEAPQ